MVYQKREELEAELHISTRENCLQSPMLKKDTSWATINSTTLVRHLIVRKRWRPVKNWRSVETISRRASNAYPRYPPSSNNLPNNRCAVPWLDPKLQRMSPIRLPMFIKWMLGKEDDGFPVGFICLFYTHLPLASFYVCISLKENLIKK